MVLVIDHILCFYTENLHFFQALILLTQISIFLSIYFRTHLLDNADQIDCWAHINMQFTRAKYKRLGHNHLKIHKVRYDASGCGYL